MRNTAHIIIGSGIESCSRTQGKFDVHYMGAVMSFENLEDAAQLYESLQGEVYLWDVTKGASLLEAKLSTSHHLLSEVF